jgi:glycosyltransferase involved in cell wall biosynthesis
VEFKLLQLGQVNIVNPNSGSRLRNYCIAHQLAKVMQVTHLGFHEPDEMVQSVEIKDQIRVSLVPRATAYTIAKLVRGALGGTPVTLLNFYSTRMAAELARELVTSRYDTVLIEGIEMVPYLPMIQTAKSAVRHVVLDWHNIESEVVARHLLNAQTTLHRLYMRRVVSQLKRVEDEMLERCDLHLVTSDRERHALLSRRPWANVVVVENGVDSRHFGEPSDGAEHSLWQTARDRILFVGSMDFSGNVDAVTQFAEQIWPGIHQTFPKLVFTIVGRNPPERVRTMGLRPGIQVTGTVEDVRPYYHEALAAVVPVRVGGGTRLKILEAMAAGVPVVSTRVGAEGLRVEPETHFLPAETPAEFHAQLKWLREDFALWGRLSSLGRKLVQSIYDWDTIGLRLVETYLNLLRLGRSGSIKKTQAWVA